MHLCISKLIIIGSDKGLSPSQPQAIIWTNAGILLIEPLETNFSEIYIKIHTSSFKKIAFENTVWKMSAILSWRQCINRTTDWWGLSELPTFITTWPLIYEHHNSDVIISIMAITNVTGPLRGESTSDWWIPLTKGQYCKKQYCCALFCCGYVSSH